MLAQNVGIILRHIGHSSPATGGIALNCSASRAVSPFETSRQSNIVRWAVVASVVVPALTAVGAGGVRCRRCCWRVAWRFCKIL